VHYIKEIKKKRINRKLLPVPCLNNADTDGNKAKKERNQTEIRAQTRFPEPAWRHGIIVAITATKV
jgi:hypothetical protein